MNILKQFGCSFCLLFIFLCAPSCDLGPTTGAFLRVDSERCVGCRICVRVCNADAITMLSEKAIIDPSKCIECAKCVDACPYDAIE